MECTTRTLRARRRRQDLIAARVLVAVAMALAVLTVVLRVSDAATSWRPTTATGACLAVLAGLILVARARSNRWDVEAW